MEAVAFETAPAPLTETLGPELPAVANSWATSRVAEDPQFEVDRSGMAVGVIDLICRDEEGEGGEVRRMGRGRKALQNGLRADRISGTAVLGCVGCGADKDGGE